jgi:hypothetical protein
LAKAYTGDFSRANPDFRTGPINGSRRHGQKTEQQSGLKCHQQAAGRQDDDGRTKAAALTPDNPQARCAHSTTLDRGQIEVVIRAAMLTRQSKRENA